MRKRKLNGKLLFVFIVLAIFIVAGLYLEFALNLPYFKIENLMNVTRQSSTIALCAMAMGMVLITRGIDLGTGGFMAFCAMISGLMMLAGANIYLSMLVGLAIGAAIGFFNGILISKIEMPPFIATYVTGQIAAGFAMVLGKGKSIGGMPDEYMAIGNDVLFGFIPISTVIMIIFWITLTIIMKYTRVGKHIYAIGGNEMTVRLEGVKVDRVKIFAYTVSGFCASAAGILLSSQMNAVHPTQGSTYQLDAVAAAVIGGVSMLGGEGKIYMPVLGALIIGFLRNMLTFIGIHPYYQNLAVGAAIIVVVGISVFNRNKELEAAKVF
ncbi:MAG: ABC transporter permease [Christensenellales bacterium]